MLIKTITFEIPNLQDSTTEEFIVENTPENYEMVMTHRRTRNIKFDRAFDFEFEKIERMPVEFIDARVWLALLPEMEEMMTEEMDNELTEKANELTEIEYIDINTGEIKTAEFFEAIPELAQTRLRDSDGTLFVITQWQRDLSNAK
jgi:hypothetical protein